MSCHVLANPAPSVPDSEWVPVPADPAIDSMTIDDEGGPKFRNEKKFGLFSRNEKVLRGFNLL